METPTWALDVASDWAQERLRIGAETPWTAYRLMQLIEAIVCLSDGAAAVTTDHSPQSVEQKDEPLPQEAKIYQLDDFRSHPAEPPVQLPT